MRIRLDLEGARGVARRIYTPAAVTDLKWAPGPVSL